MKNLFQHKYILRTIAFAVLAVAIVNISLPKIEEFNSTVHEEQNKLKIEANGVDNRTVSFGIYSLYRGVNFNSIFTVILAALFLSLLITQRIILSLLFAVSLFFQIIALAAIRIDYFANSYYIEFLFIACWFSLSFWLASATCRLIHSKFQSEIFLK